MKNNLEFLKKGGCTSRVIDLYSINKTTQPDDIRSKGLLKHPIFEAAFVIKHNLRAHERERVIGDRSVVTKIVIPIDKTNFEAGAYAIFFERHGFVEDIEAFAGEICAGSRLLSADIEMLERLSNIPSFDPFLLKESLDGQNVSDAYFVITDIEEEEVVKNSINQVKGIVSVAFGVGTSQNDQKAARLAGKLFSPNGGPELEALRLALRLDDTQYERGMFGWKGLLYYNWRMAAISNDLRRFFDEIKGLRYPGATYDESNYLNMARQDIILKASHRWSRLLETMTIYRSRMNGFTINGNATDLRDFFLEAPNLFFRLGDDLSAVEHICSYWQYWQSHSQSDRGGISTSDLLEILPEFSTSLSFSAPVAPDGKELNLS